MTVWDDNRLEDTPMVRVACRRCEATVLVRKSSWAQTSIQWTADSYAACPERQAADELSEHGPRGVFLSCSALKESIVDAVRRGEVAVVDEAVGSSP